MGTSDPPPRVPVEDARKNTDTSLASERAEADQGLLQKLTAEEQRTDRKIEATREQVDSAIEAVKEAAAEQAAAPAVAPSALDDVVEKQKARVEDALTKPGAEDRAGEPRRQARKALEVTKAAAEEAIEAEKVKAQAAVERVSEQAHETLQAERQRIDELTQHEREERKRDFLEVLAAERRQTNEALQLERHSVDVLVRSRDELLAMISHDLRNYLNAIAAKAAMSSKATDLSHVRRLSGEISASCITMARWANDLVDLASMDKGYSLSNDIPRTRRRSSTPRSRPSPPWLPARVWISRCKYPRSARTCSVIRTGSSKC
jgi:signal transduction histidine kinase